MCDPFMCSISISIILKRAEVVFCEDLRILEFELEYMKAF